MILFYSLLVFAGSLHSQIINPKPLSHRLTGYNFDVKLDTATKTVTGTMEAFWINNTSEVVQDIQLHMYMNAFKSRNSTLYKESGRSPGKKRSDQGWINIISLTDRNVRGVLFCCPVVPEIRGI